MDILILAALLIVLATSLVQCLVTAWCCRRKNQVAICNLDPRFAKKTTVEEKPSQKLVLSDLPDSLVISSRGYAVHLPSCGHIAHSKDLKRVKPCQHCLRKRGY